MNAMHAWNIFVFCIFLLVEIVWLSGTTCDLRLLQEIKMVVVGSILRGVIILKLPSFPRSCRRIVALSFPTFALQVLRS